MTAGRAGCNWHSGAGNFMKPSLSLTLSAVLLPVCNLLYPPYWDEAVNSCVVHALLHPTPAEGLSSIFPCSGAEVPGKVPDWCREELEV